VTLGVVSMLAITAVFTAAAPLFVAAYTDGFSPELKALSVAFALWTIPQLFFYGVYTLFGQILNARSRFGPFMWAPAANNVVAIAGLVVFLVIFGPHAMPSGGDDATTLVGDWDAGKIALLAGVSTLGIAVQALVLIVPLARSGYRWRWQWSGPKGELDGIKRVAGWALAAVLLEQVGILFVTRVATNAAAESGQAADVAGNTALTNALMLYLLPHSLITVSIVTALFTGMARLGAANDMAGLRAELSRGLRTIAIFTIYATAALAVLAPLAVRVTAPTASPDEIASIARVVIALSAGLISLGAMILVKQAYLALEDARSLFWIQIPMTATLIAIAFGAQELLDYRWWVVAIGAGMAASYAIATALRLQGLRRRLGGLDGRRVLSTHLRAFFAILPAAAAGWGLLRIVPDPAGLSRWAEVGVSAAWCLAIGALMGVIYGVGLVVLRVDEWRSAVAGPLRRLGFRVP
jgi:putative peptidoglycan lipid II flippase